MADAAGDEKSSSMDKLKSKLEGTHLHNLKINLTHQKYVRRPRCHRAKTNSSIIDIRLENLQTYLTPSIAMTRPMSRLPTRSVRMSARPTASPPTSPRGRAT